MIANVGEKLKNTGVLLCRIWDGRRQRSRCLQPKPSRLQAPADSKSWSKALGPLDNAVTQVLRDLATHRGSRIGEGSRTGERVSFFGSTF